MRLTTTDHDRDYDGMEYIYPVVSRRSGGVSVGVNLNPNKACNWRCVYCQVPDLVRGSGPDIDTECLARELHTLLDDIVHDDFFERLVPEGARVLKDIAFSGDGESTSSPQFEECVTVVGDALGHFGLSGVVNLVLITNGSLVRQERVTAGLRVFEQLGGEIWFKLDRGSDEALQRVNGTRTTLAAQLMNLTHAASLCPTWIQTCMFATDGEAPSQDEVDDYLRVLTQLLEERVPVKGVLLYGMARPPMLPEAVNLSRLEAAWLEELGERIRALGLAVSVSP